MSFWETSTGQVATGEVSENNFDDTPLPKGDYLCMIEEAKINDYQGQRSIAFKIRAIDEKRVIFPKLKAFDQDEKKRDRAINLLVKLANVLGVNLPDDEPDDRWLSKLMDKPVIVKFDAYDMVTADGKALTGNFIINFSAKGGSKAPEPKRSAPSQRQAPRDDDSDIPF